MFFPSQFLSLLFHDSLSCQFAGVKVIRGLDQDTANSNAWQVWARISLFLNTSGRIDLTLEEVADVGCRTSLLEVRRLLRFERNPEFVKNSQEMASTGQDIFILVRKGKEEWFPLPRSRLMNLFSLPKTSPGRIGTCWCAAWGSGSLWVWQGRC